MGDLLPSRAVLRRAVLGRARITGIEPGNRIRLEGRVGIGADGRPTMINPAYELVTSP